MSVNFRRIIVVAISLSFAGNGFAQIQVPDQQEEDRKDRIGSGILDDTTTQIYGPTTTRYTYESNVKFNNQQYWFIDTSVVNMHRYQFMAQENNFYQDLGNIGTAAAPIYPQIPDQIGATSGFNVYDLYYSGPETVKYYDTQSPYSDFTVIWGGQGRAVTEATYTRNIDVRSNVGFDYRGIFIDKQIQRSGRGDRHAEGIYYRAFAKYRTKNGRYAIMGNFSRNNHTVDEYGGILTTGEEIGNDVYFEDTRQPRLTGAESAELRTNYHLYHQFKLKEFIQLYHSFDRYKQQNDFTAQPETTSGVFDVILLDSAQTNDRSKIVYNLNEVGMKGDIGKTFYNFYYKLRKVDFDYRYLSSGTLNFETDYLENYAGFNLRFGNDSVSYISAYGEYMLGGEYKLGGEIRNSWFYARLASSQNRPSYIQRAYLGNHDAWENDFDLPISSSLSSGIRVNIGPLTLMPSAEYNLFSNYIYFRKFDVEEGEQAVLPTQASADISLLKAQLGLSLDFLKVFNINANVIYANVAGGSSEAVSVPELFGNAQLSYHDILFDGNLEWQVGVDAHVKTAYYAQGYDPVIMQFYVQDDFEVPFFPVVDAFINAKISRVRFFFKYNNFLQAFRQNGYFLTPYYPAQAPIFDFGFTWPFYD